MQINRIFFTLLFIIPLTSCLIVKPYVYTYRSDSKMSKDDIDMKYNLSIDNTVAEPVQVLFNKTINLSQHPNKKKLSLKILLYDVDDINLNPYICDKNVNLKIIGIDNETNDIVFETFAKSVIDGTRFKTHRVFNAFTNRNMYAYGSPYNVGVTVGDDIVKVMQEQILFLIKQSLKLIGSNIYVDNVESDFNLEKFIKKSEK